MSEDRENECQRLYSNLLNLLTKSKTTAPTYVRELMKTVKCDDISNFSEIRQLGERYIDKESLNRIILTEETLQDEKNSVNFLHNTRYNHKDLLWKSLNWKYKWYYAQYCPMIWCKDDGFNHMVKNYKDRKRIAELIFELMGTIP